MSDERPGMATEPAADSARTRPSMPDLAEIDVPRGAAGARSRSCMSRYPDHHSAALPALRAAQRLHGWCSPEAIDQVAAVMQVTPAYLSSVATFYDMLNTEPVGRQYVWVCTSVACMPKNAKAVYDAIKEAGGDLEDVHIREFECLGACDMAPMASVERPLHRPAPARRRRADRRGAQARRAAAARTGARAMAEETRVLLENIDEPGLATIEVYERLGGYSRLRRRLVDMDRGGARPRARGVRPARPRRRRLRDGQEGELHPEGRDGQVPLLQRGRVRARHVQGPPADAEEPAPPDRGHHHRRARRRREPRVHLHPRRVRAAGADPREGARGGEGEGLRRRAHPRLGLLARARGSTAARAPTSAARSRRCSTRSRASAATRASSRRSPRTRASTRARR